MTFGLTGIMRTRHLFCHRPPTPLHSTTLHCTALHSTTLHQCTARCFYNGLHSSVHFILRDTPTSPSTAGLQITSWTFCCTVHLTAVPLCQLHRTAWHRLHDAMSPLLHFCLLLLVIIIQLDWIVVALHCIVLHCKILHCSELH